MDRLTQYFFGIFFRAVSEGTPITRPGVDLGGWGARPGQVSCRSHLLSVRAHTTHMLRCTLIHINYLHLLLKVISKRTEQRHVITSTPKHLIAATTQQATRFASLMIVVGV